MSNRIKINPSEKLAQMSFIPYSRQWISDSEIQDAIDVLKADFVTQGEIVSQFEESLAKVSGAKYAVAVSSGTAALHVLAMALVKDENTVCVTSPITFAATSNAFLHCGSALQFTDVDPESGLMDPDSLKDVLAKIAVDPKKKIIVIPVSFSGSSSLINEISEISKEYGATVIEDAAHSLGSEYKAKETLFKSGSCAHTDAAIFSFHPVKHICTCEGGAVLTNDAELAQSAKRLRCHGVSHACYNDDGELEEKPGWWYTQVDLGLNYRMTEIQAKLGLSQLKRFPTFLFRRREIAARYERYLAEKPYSDVFKLPPPDAGHAYHLYVIRFENGDIRNEAYEFLKKRGVASQVHYIPVYHHQYYREKFGKVSLTGTEDFFNGCLSIPLFPRMTKEEQNTVITVLGEFCQSVDAD